MKSRMLRRIDDEAARRRGEFVGLVGSVIIVACVAGVALVLGAAEIAASVSSWA